MRKYEIMLILKGTLPEDSAKKMFEETKLSLTSSKNINVTEHGVKKLAYPIKNEQTGYYFQLNFESDGKDVEEFRRVTNLNSNVLRALIINLEHDYGYKSISNPVKAKKLEQKIAKKNEFDAKRAAENLENGNTTDKFDSNRPRSNFKRNPKEAGNE